jgi:NADPH:quinone reductase-like Zn-dependent oxidoreductase
MLGWLGDGTVRFDIQDVLSMDDAAAAHERIEGRQVKGKLLMRIRT